MSGCIYCLLTCALGVTLIVQKVLEGLIDILRTHGEPPVFSVLSVLGFVWAILTIWSYTSGTLHGYHHLRLW